MPDANTLSWMFWLGGAAALLGLAGAFVMHSPRMQWLRDASDSALLTPEQIEEREALRRAESAQVIVPGGKIGPYIGGLLPGLYVAAFTWLVIEVGERDDNYLRYFGVALAVFSMLSFLRRPLGEVGVAADPDTQDEFPRGMKLAGFAAGIAMALV